MAPHIFTRQENSATTNNYIAAGGIIAGFVGFFMLLCLLCRLHFQRSKTNKRLERQIKERSAAFYRVGDIGRPMAAETNSPSKSIPPPFSRQWLTASIVMPEKSITRKLSSHGLSDKAVVSSQLQPSPTSSTPSFQRPPSNASSASPRPRTMSILNPASSRRTRSSSGFSAYAQYLFPPGSNSRPSSAISTSSSQARSVRQLFEPTLPDELALARFGECLTVLRSFDDGWCVVARDTSRSSRVSRVSTWMARNGDNVDIGLVPAWVFIKPLKGVTVTRPFRGASVNALHLGHNFASEREAIISWSNFA